MTKKKPSVPEEDPRETPLDNPRQKTDWPTTKQTDEPWKGNPEKEQRNDSGDIDLEKWHRTNTDSEDPDHYKRAGAMLRALYKSDIVTGIEFAASSWGTIEQVESGARLRSSIAVAPQLKLGSAPARISTCWRIAIPVPWFRRGSKNVRQPITLDHPGSNLGSRRNLFPGPHRAVAWRPYFSQWPVSFCRVAYFDQYRAVDLEPALGDRPMRESMLHFSH